MSLLALYQEQPSVVPELTLGQLDVVRELEARARLTRAAVEQLRALESRSHGYQADAARRERVAKEAVLALFDGLVADLRAGRLR